MTKLLRGIFLDTVREFDGIFWPLVFPLILFFILVSVFGNMGSSNSIHFTLGLYQPKELAGFGKILESVLEQIEPEPFRIVEYETFSEALRALLSNKVDLLLEIPEDFSMNLTGAILTGGRTSASLRIHRLAGKMESETANRVLGTILNSLNVEIFKRTQGTDFVDVETEVRTVNRPNVQNFHYPTYLFPGILLMAIMSIGFFNFPLWLVFSRTLGLNKRLFATSLTPVKCLLSLVLANFIMMSISSSLVYAFGSLVYRVSPSIFCWKFVVALFFSMVISLSIGLLLVSIFPKPSSALVSSQVLYQVMMFVGGLYFPVLTYNVPNFLKYLALVLPSTHLAELMRNALGHAVYSLPNWQMWLVPTAWLIASVLLFVTRFKWVMGYE